MGWVTHRPVLSKIHHLHGLQIKVDRHEEGECNWKDNKKRQMSHVDPSTCQQALWTQYEPAGIWVFCIPSPRVLALRKDARRTFRMTSWTLKPQRLGKEFGQQFQVQVSWSRKWMLSSSEWGSVMLHWYDKNFASILISELSTQLSYSTYKTSKTHNISERPLGFEQIPFPRPDFSFVPLSFVLN